MITVSAMQKPPGLTVTFLAHAPMHVAESMDPNDFESQLRCAWEIGRDPWWPQVVVPAHDFVRHLAQRLPRDREGTPLPRLLDELALSDLYLACACVNGVPASMEMLESHYLAKLPTLLGYLKLPAMVLDDVCQSVRIHLLVETDGAVPRLARYTGRGALLSWLRIVAVRMALKEVPSLQELPEENLLAALEAMPMPAANTDLELIKRRYRHEFRQALSEAFAELPGAQRHHLWKHFIEQQSTTRMAEDAHVNQSTVSRWLKKARKAVYEGTKRRLQKRLGLSSKEFTSLIAVIRSRFDLSLSQVFKKEG